MFSMHIRKNQSFKKASKRFSNISNNIRPVWHKHRISLFFGAGLIFLLSLVAAQFIKAEEVAETREESTVAAETLELDQRQGYQTIQALVQDETSTTLVAQSSGPVQNIYVETGQQVQMGTWIINQASSYGGGNQANISRQIAERNLESAEINLRNTQESVAKNRQLADLNQDNAEALTDITRQSLGETRNLIELIEDQIEILEEQIEATDDPQAKQSLQGQLISLKGNLNQVQSGYRNARYSADENQAATDIPEANRELVQIQTQLQLDTARINQEIAQLNLQSARLAESLTRVVAPYAGTIEAILVNPGDFVQPGTPVAVISNNQTQYKLSVAISGQTARQLQTAEYLEFELDDQTERIQLEHVSTVPVAGGMFQITATIPERLNSRLISGQSLDIRLPVTQELSGNVLIPITSVYITNTETFVYVLEDERATHQPVEIGQIIGENIEVRSGLIGDETLILSRNVTEGQRIRN